MSVLKIKDENGNWIGIPSIKGEKGEDGGLTPHALSHATGGTDEITPENIGAAPISHESLDNTYGEGSSTHYGHVKLSDSVESTSDEESGVAATPAAVKAAYDLASGKAPAYTYGTEDLTAGESELATGTLHFVYE